MSTNLRDDSPEQEPFNLSGAVCSECIGDPTLSEEIRTTGSRRKCQVCGKRRKARSLDEVVGRVNEIYRLYYEPGAFWPDSDQMGDYPEEIVQELLVCEYELAEWIVRYLADEEGWTTVRDGDVPMLDPTTRYEAVETEPWAQRAVWEEFEDHIKYERRFVGDQGGTLLQDLLGELPQIIDRFDLDVRLILDPGAPQPDPLFRARLAEYPDHAPEIARGAPKELGPPPLRANVGGRMHPPGISAFYGSFSRATAVRELRPHVGAEVVTGEFRAKRSLALLDVPALSEASASISMFEPDYYKISTMLQFLKSFHELISRPVFPAREQLD